MYGNLKSESSMTLISLFPELRSDTLVQQQLDIYIKNSNKIKALKEEKISDIPMCRWRLYFGR